MNKVSFFILIFSVVFFSGCSGKQYFEPAKSYSVSKNSFNGKIIDVSRDGATLDNGHFIGKSGANYRISLGEGYRYLSESSKYVLATNTQGILNVIDKNTKKSIRAVSLHVPVVSATIQNGLIAYILNNNTFGLYRIADNRKIIESRSEKTFAIDTRSASPMFVDNLIVMPMLDGKLIIIDSKNINNTKVVYLSSHKVFNNIIYLSRMGNTMIAATATKMITLGTNGKQEYQANISEITVDNSNIYIFTKEGEVVKLNATLQPIATKKFKYAHFSAATALGGRVFGLDQQGSLMVFSSDLNKYKIYDVGKVKNPPFIHRTQLYKDGKIITLSSLGYE